MRKPLLAVALAFGLGVVVTVAACSSGSGASPAPQAQTPTVPPVACGDHGLTIAFNPMYSAFDGTHIFQIPALVVGSNDSVTWSADATMVQMQADNERPNEVLITMLKAGAVNINVQSNDGKCGSSLLTITAAEESDWEIGSARYNDGISLHLSGTASGTGSPLEQGGSGPACTNCHGESATKGPFTDVSHTPEQTGGFSDDDLLGIILHGTFPAGAYFDPSIVMYSAWQNFHRWTDITPDEQRGIIVYLRSLPPASQKGSVNFGAFDDDAGTANLDAGDDGDNVAVDAANGELDAADAADVNGTIDGALGYSGDSGATE